VTPKTIPHSQVQQEAAEDRSIVVGTAGHIDHGKTALVYALTGTDTDRLPEEKRRGITIDLGFASLRLPDGRGHMLDLSIVDVPGHHAFVRNMLAGAAGIDCVMLVIAADEGVKPQTEEHLAICSLLGICRGVVALTKSDNVEAERLRDVCASARDCLHHSFLEGAPIVPTSVRTGEGISELKRALATLALHVPERSVNYFPRLPLDRAFSIHGFGTVVTGTLQNGTIREGDTLVQQPANRSVRVRGVQVHKAARKTVHAPSRVALNLTGVELGEIRRGDTLVPPHTLATVNVIDVELTSLPGLPLPRHRSKVRVHAFASESMATVLLYEPAQSVGSGRTLARLRLVTPLLLIPGDRFVLRQCTPAVTIGGGSVLDIRPLSRAKKAVTLAWLQQLTRADAPEQLRLRVLRHGKSGISTAELIAETGLTPDAIARMMQPLIVSGRVISAGSQPERILSAEALAAIADLVMGELERAAPAGLAKAELQSKNRLDPSMLELAIRRLARAGKVDAAAEGVTLAGRGHAVSDEVRGGAEAVEAIYLAGGLAAPLLSEVAARLAMPPRTLREVITHLLRAKRLVRMGADIAFTHIQPLEKLYADLRQRKGETFDVARFKSFTGLTRKHAIPLLEHLDQVHIMSNSGGVRVIL
jgi:selenocysteine-specific elongation factor